MKKFVFYSLLILLALVAYTLYEYFRFNDSDLHLVMCDVGQGEAIFITTPAKTQILIDGGPGKEVLNCLSNNMPFWDRSIDLVILTHPHADHFSGLISVIDRYSLRAFYTQDIKTESEGYKLLEANLADKNLSAKYLKKNDKFSDISGLEFRVLWPSTFRLEEIRQNSTNYDLNESSIIALITFGKFSALLTGDAEENSLDQVKTSVKSINVLKIPHHGSTGSVNNELLMQLKPSIALISVGKDNKFGHPSGETLNLLNKFKVKTFRTDLDGEIKITTDGDGFEFSSERN